MTSYKWLGPGNELVKGDNPDKVYLPGDSVSLDADELAFLLRLGHTFEGVGPEPGQPLVGAPGSFPISPPGQSTAGAVEGGSPKASKDKDDKD